MITLYGIKNCDSVKKARKFFKERGIDVEFVDFKETPVGCDVVDGWLQKSDISLLFNARGTTYRKLELKKLDLDDRGKRDWLCKENLLIKRPVIVYNDNIIVGFNQQQYEGAFRS